MDGLPSEILLILLMEACENELVNILGLPISSLFFLGFLAISGIFGSGAQSTGPGVFNATAERVGHLNCENCHGDDNYFSHGTLVTTFEQPTCLGSIA